LKHKPRRFRAVGTTPEWTQVLEFGGVFALAMLFIDAITNRERLAKWPNLFVTAVIALVVGMLEVFGWKVLHGGIGLLFVAVLLVTFGTGFVLRRARKREKIASKMG
jgi:cytochrome bd-type quinol oxidase subunit 2